ncbi:hypothetical protein ACOACO_10570 [Nocardioides sp. CPCC 205120]|uniref:hypothetical protein n=1 Tax=Nocardioides sp. CPCC 205120 TaxID=3406462 RepID=UPI003B509586
MKPWESIVHMSHEERLAYETEQIREVVEELLAEDGDRASFVVESGTALMWGDLRAATATLSLVEDPEGPRVMVWADWDSLFGVDLPLPENVTAVEQPLNGEENTPWWRSVCREYHREHADIGLSVLRGDCESSGELIGALVRRRSWTIHTRHHGTVVLGQSRSRVFPSLQWSWGDRKPPASTA